MEAEANLTFNQDFFVGYSPERINPGDKEHRVGDILKVTSGSNESIALTIDDFMPLSFRREHTKRAQLK